MEKLIDVNRLPVGENIVHALRVCMGDMSNGELGAKLGMSRQGVRQTLDPKNDIKYSSIYKFCKALGYHVELVKDEVDEK